MTHLVIAFAFSVQAWLLNGQVAVQHDPRGWSVPVVMGARVYNAHHEALRRLTRETRLRRPKARR